MNTFKKISLAGLSFFSLGLAVLPLSTFRTPLGTELFNCLTAINDGAKAHIPVRSILFLLNSFYFLGFVVILCLSFYCFLEWYKGSANYDQHLFDICFLIIFLTAFDLIPAFFGF